MLQARERIRELERELEILQQKLLNEEDKSNKVYLHMYAKEKENDGASTSSSTTSLAKKVTVPELMHQLQVTQDELENIKVSKLFFLNIVFVFWEFYGLNVS